MSKVLSAIVSIALIIFTSPALAAMVSVVATGTVSEVTDPDNLLPFGSLVVGQTPGILTFQYDDQIPTTGGIPSTVALYETGQSLTMMLGGETVTKAPMTITIFDDWESQSTPGQYRDSWQAHAASRQVNDPEPDIIYIIDFWLSTFALTTPIPTLDSTDLIKPEWPDGWGEGVFRYSIFSQPQGTSEFNVLAQVKVNVEILSAVPIPAAFWLFGSALGLLGWIRRR